MSKRARAAKTCLKPVHRLFVAIRPPEKVRDLLIDTMDLEQISAGRETNSFILPCVSSAKSSA